MFFVLHCSLLSLSLHSQKQDKQRNYESNWILDHCNINVTDIERSIKFYEEAVGLHVNSRMEAKDGSFIIVKLTDDKGLYELELTWLKDHPQPYELGDNESHICFRVAEDYNEVFEFHKSKDGFVMKIMTCISTSSTTLTDIGSKFYR